MAKINIGSSSTTVTANTANTTYVLAKGQSIETQESGILSPGSAEGVRFEIAGRIESKMDDGLEWGNDVTGQKPIAVRIAASGQIDALKGIAVRLYGDGQEVDNAGRISAIQGININGSSFIRNSGHIEVTGAAINTFGDATIVNSGVLASTQYAINLHASAGDTGNVIRNSGTISGSIAILGTGLEERVVNSGTITGDIKLGAGADTFVFKAGSTSAVEGGAGDDRYVVRVENAAISEAFGNGFDLVLSSVTFALPDNVEQINLVGKAHVNATGNSQSNHIQGNAGRNVLHGEIGGDFLIGMAGNDRLFGGADADYFNFQKGSGTDRVMDFEAGIDEIQIGGLKGAKDFADMMANHVEAKGGDIWITYGQDVVILKDTAMGDLATGDFVFG